MKKISLFLSALLFSAISMATTVTVTFDAASDKGNAGTDSNNAAAYQISKDGITLDVTQGIIGTNNDVTHYRIYKSQTLTISCTAGSMTKVEFTCMANDDTKYGPGGFTANSGSYTYSGKVGTWTGEASTIVFAASTNQVRASKIVITYETSGEEVIYAPVIAGESNFRESTEVSISAEAGLDVYYTLDGTIPTAASTQYTVPFTLTETTTVKAIAYDAAKAKTSDVVEATFNKIRIITCAEAVALCTPTTTTEKYIIRGYVSEMIEAFNAQYGNITFWMADTKNGGQVLQVYRAKPVSEVEKTLQVGDYVEVIGALVLYGETPEVSTGGSVEKITDPGTSAVDNVVVEKRTTKFFENGQLVIVKEGVRYNAQGQVL